MNRIEVNLQTGETVLIPLTQEEIDALPAPEIAVPRSISDRQFFQQLAVMGLIGPTEALAAVKTGELPGVLQALVDQMDEDARFATEMILSGATQFERSHPLVGQLAAAVGWPPEQIDQFWIAASQL
jgi:hypothetical protein